MVSYNRNYNIFILLYNSKYHLLDNINITDTKLWLQLMNEFYCNLDFECNLKFLDLLLQMNLLQNDLKTSIQPILSSMLQSDSLMTQLPESLWSKMILSTINGDLDFLETTILNVILQYVKIQTLPLSIIDYCLNKGSVAHINILSKLISNSPFHMIIFENRLSKLNLNNIEKDSPEFLNFLLYYSKNINRDNKASGKCTTLMHPALKYKWSSIE